MEYYPNLFCNYKPLKGKDWLRHIPPEDRRVFVSIGLEACEHGRMGGEARAKTAKRDLRGKFMKGD